jgi:hypothetical protein
MRRRAPEVRSSPRGAPRDARVAGTPLRGPRAAHRGIWIPACAGMSGIGRREFILALGAAAAVWPLAARAQQPLPAIGFLHEGLPAPLSLTTAFQQGLIEAGVSAGSSLRIENRWAEGQYDRLPALARI